MSEMLLDMIDFHANLDQRLMDIHGNLIGFIEEVDFSKFRFLDLISELDLTVFLGFMKAIMRQVYRLHRPFTVNIYDVHMNHILTVNILLLFKYYISIYTES